MRRMPWTGLPRPLGTAWGATPRVGGGGGQELTYGRSIYPRGSALSRSGRSGVPRTRGGGRAGRAR
jgi:hypothetical protein